MSVKGDDSMTHASFTFTDCCQKQEGRPGRERCAQYHFAQCMLSWCWHGAHTPCAVASGWEVGIYGSGYHTRLWRSGSLLGPASAPKAEYSSPEPWSIVHDDLIVAVANYVSFCGSKASDGHRIHE
eukprot:scaffold44392_cov41-Tisochrysis_lutea.AAC.1